MKRPTKSQIAQRDLLAALGMLRQLTKEAGGNYIARLQTDVSSVEVAVREVAKEGLLDRKKLNQFRTMLKLLTALDVKPQKGRRRDLKQIEQTVIKLESMASDW